MGEYMDTEMQILRLQTQISEVELLQSCVDLYCKKTRSDFNEKIHWLCEKEIQQYSDKIERLEDKL